jgi:hypothetical protein
MTVVEFLISRLHQKKMLHRNYVKPIKHSNDLIKWKVEPILKKNKDVLRELKPFKQE